ncbi:MAG: hypothetical protein ACXWYF_10075, partial [Actinomycetota bacterium]
RDVTLQVQRMKVDDGKHELKYAAVTSLPALIQLVGYLKYKYSIGDVLLRGRGDVSGAPVDRAAL